MIDPSRPILGIWGYSSDAPDVMHHDSGAAVVVGGRIVSAVNEERISRRKNEGRWPAAAIDEVISLAGIGIKDLGAVAMAGLPPITRSMRMAGAALRTFRREGILLGNRLLYALLTAKKIARRPPGGIDCPVVSVAHHDAHAASAYYTSPFEDAVVVTMDGIGDSSDCGGVWTGRGGRLDRLRLFNGYASPGILYSFVTKSFGFKPARHEGKVTGLAAYGDDSETGPIFRDLVRYDPARKDLFSSFIPRLFSYRTEADWRLPLMDDLLDRYSREDIAAGVQRMMEEVASEIVADAVRETGIRNVALAGGVFANVRVNQVIRELDCVDDIWIHPHMGDGGLGVGAALHLLGEASSRAGKRLNPVPPDDLYLGRDITEKEAEDALLDARLEFTRPPDPSAEVVAALKSGLIIGRCAGRMEYGPRALGNRTILAEARDRSINDSLNKRLRRTEFMPFAPIVREEEAGIFRSFKRSDRAARFMTITYDVSPEAAEKIPAVVHVDGTARPQVVVEGGNPGIRAILSRYMEETGIPAVINTSFNIHEEPIVASAADAVRSALAGSVDRLLLGPFWARLPGTREAAR